MDEDNFGNRHNRAHQDDIDKQFEDLVCRETSDYPDNNQDGDL